MTETNSKRLYEHYVKTTKSGASEQVRKMAERNVAMMLKAYPHFAEVPKEETKSKGKK